MTDETKEVRYSRVIKDQGGYVYVERDVFEHFLSDYRSTQLTDEKLLDLIHDDPSVKMESDRGVMKVSLRENVETFSHDEFMNNQSYGVVLELSDKFEIEDPSLILPSRGTVLNTPTPESLGILSQSVSLEQARTLEDYMK